MITHQAIGMHLPAGLEANFPKSFQETFQIRIIVKDRLLPIPTIHDTCPDEALARRRMIDCSWLFDAKFSGHAVRIMQLRESLEANVQFESQPMSPSFR